MTKVLGAKPTSQSIQAVKLMPRPLLESDLTDPKEADKVLKAIEFQTQKDDGSQIKHKYLACHASGHGGSQQAIPHALACKTALEEIDNLTVWEQVKGFKASLVGTALDFCKATIDHFSKDENKQGVTFEKFLIHYCQLFGTSPKDRRNQIDGIPHLTKPPNVDCQRWVLMLANIRKAVPHCKGVGGNIDEESWPYTVFKTFPQPWQDDYNKNTERDSATAKLSDILASYACRACIHSTMKLSPGAAVFNRDMLLDIPVVADFRLLQERRQMMIDKNLKRANRSRVAIDYQPGDKVLKLLYKPDKLEPRAIGPFPIEKTHVNGTLTIRINPNVTQRVNIRKLRPFNEKLPIEQHSFVCQLGLF